MGMLDGKVAFITGAARGQGRSHAVRLAEEGASIIAIDICDQIATVPYPMATAADLAETVTAVEAVGGRIIAATADVRDIGSLEKVLSEGVTEFGRLDIVCANAGICSGSTPLWETPHQLWQDTIDVNLTGVWNTAKASIPHVLESGGGGSIILTNSALGLKGMDNLGEYVAAKHGVVGVMRTLARELSSHGVRVNSVHPTTVNTDMIHNDFIYGLYRPDLEHPTAEDALPAFGSINMMATPWVESRDVSNAVLWLASDESRFVTGVTLPVDAGFLIK